jgi:hypothetical protein
MNQAYQNIISARAEDQRGLFLAATNRLGTTVQNIEKDFWVCWTLDALFNRLAEGGPRLLFKGGTSLSKGYDLISRFSEDIDITVFREDIGQAASAEDLELLSRRKRGERLDAIKAACQKYINDQLRPELATIAAQTMKAAGKAPASLQIMLDENDQDRQSLLIRYPSAVEKADYITPSIKIETGAKSALDPHEDRTITPYLSPDVPGGDALAVNGVMTIDSERTFLDKILILHGLTHYFEAQGTVRGDGRMSRHYYDVHRIMANPVGEKACQDNSLIEDCVQHAKMFFYRGNTGLDAATRGSFRLRPIKEMLEPLKKDYAAMATMIFGEVPTFEEILASVARAEERLNAA